MEKSHTSREFEKELRTLRERLLVMGGRAEQQLGRAMESALRGDASQAQRVIDEDEAIDHDEIEIDELAFLIMARRQPVASDLRFIMLALKVVTDLERIGDLAVNIAKRSLQLQRYAPSPVISKLDLLSQKVIAVLRDVLDAFVHADATKAESVIKGDVEIDRINTEVIGDVIALDLQVHDLGRGLALSSISRYLERVGDHATNIAEMVIYYLRGRDIRHHGLEK